MAIFKLQKIDGQNSDWKICEYTSLYKVLVRAKSESEARKIAQSVGGSESQRSTVWLDSSKTDCVELSPEGESVVLIEERTDG